MKKIFRLGTSSFIVFLAVVNIFFILFIHRFLKTNRVSDTGISSKNISVNYQIDNNVPTNDVLGIVAGEIRIAKTGTYGYGEFGSLISLTSDEEPAVEIQSTNYTGDINVNLYEIDENFILQYLVYDKESRQVHRFPEVGTINRVYSGQLKIENDKNEVKKLGLPLTEGGAWYLKIESGALADDAVIVRSKTGLIVKEGDDQMIFWGQDFKTGRSIESGHLSTYSLKDSVKLIDSGDFDSSGIIKIGVNPKSDIGVYEKEGDIAILPINLTQFSYIYRRFSPKVPESRIFLFTDRPLYRPGDKFYFKSILRNDDDARLSIPQGTAHVTISKGWDVSNTVFDKNYQISSDGTIDGEFDIPKNQSTGDYLLRVQIGSDTEYRNAYREFQIEYFRKPEYSIDVTSGANEYIKGENIPFTVTGSYFSGQPISNQSVRYSVRSYEYYDSWFYYKQDINDDYRYGWWGGNEVKTGSITLNEKGSATVNFDEFQKDIYKPQILTFEAEFDNGSGNPSFSRKNVIVYPAYFGIYTDYDAYRSFSHEVGKQVEYPVMIVPRRDTKISNVSLHVTMKREYWESYHDDNYKYPQYKRIEQNLPDSDIKTDADGKASIRFVPQNSGSYRFNISAKDEKGNEIVKEFYLWVHSEKDAYFDYTNQKGSALTIQTDKNEYDYNDTVTVSIYSETPDRDIFLSLDRARVNRYRVIKMEGKFANVEVPLTETDIPNIYLNLVSFTNDSISTASQNIVVSINSKKLIVSATPDKTSYSPSETATINVETTDFEGNPASADVALWAVDKAIFELVDENPLKVVDAFWSARYDNTSFTHSLYGINSSSMAEKGGCFTGDTLILMADGSEKKIKDIKKGDRVVTFDNFTGKNLVSGLVTQIFKFKVGGYYILNGNLKVTPEHRLWVNSNWKEVGSLEIGDLLVDRFGKSVKIETIEWISGITDVYNFEVDKYNTYFAGGIWVHNEKGGVPRTVFKDTAYWNPSLHTDINGRAQVSFKLPDNLTTWVIAAVGSTNDTRVGKERKEIIVSKDVVVRPILPNILRTGDEMVLSSIVNNFSKNDHNFKVSLESENLKVSTQKSFEGTIKAGDLNQYYWSVLPIKDGDKSKIKYSAQVTDNNSISDTVIQELPIVPFGYWDKRGEHGEGSKIYNITLSPDASKEKSKITISLSSSLVSSLVPAMKYLVDYPYGCVEQTTSRLVPAIIAQANKNIFSESLSGKDIDDMINTGIGRLKDLQSQDGGWSWWHGNTESYVTAYVTEYLVMAKSSGYEIDKDMLSRLTAYLNSKGQDSPEKNNPDYVPSDNDVVETYALSLLGESGGKKKLSNLSKLPVDILSYAVLSNVRNGYLNPDENGVNLLASYARSQGDMFYWDKGTEIRYGSVDASTALAVRALVAGGGDNKLAVGGIRYLLRNRTLDYWSNSFATSQVIRAAVGYSDKIGEFNPDYNYEVYFDNKLLSKGSVKSAKQVIKDLEVTGGFKDGGSTVEIKKSEGSGELYSLVLVEELHTDKNAKSQDKGLSITREYVNSKGYEYGVGLGDEIEVRLSVKNSANESKYAVITDELPAGLIPINMNLKNTELSKEYDYYDYNYWSSNIEYTQNGVIILTYYLPSGITTFSYKARVVSEGKFYTPPAFVSLMYSPEVYGRSAASLVSVEKEAPLIRERYIEKKANEVITAITQGRRNSYKTILLAFIAMSLVLIVFINLLFLNRVRNTFLGKLIQASREKFTQRFRNISRSKGKDSDMGDT